MLASWMSCAASAVFIPLHITRQMLTVEYQLSIQNQYAYMRQIDRVVFHCLAYLHMTIMELDVFSGNKV
jgi:hypothetical protein